MKRLIRISFSLFICLFPFAVFAQEALRLMKEQPVNLLKEPPSKVLQKPQLN
jgi:hypothetical protein